MPAMWPPDFEPCQDLSPAEWIRPRLLSWGAEMGTPVTSIVPGGYDAYVRVFHPAAPARFGSAATWQQVADWSGRRFHPLAHEKLSVSVRANPGPPPFSEAPLRGMLSTESEVCDTLVRQLSALTGTPSACYFAIWERWGILSGGWARFKAVAEGDEEPDTLDDDIARWQEQVAQLPRLEHQYRSYLVGRGPIGVACELDSHLLGPEPSPELGLTPQLWWPEDRAWVVATEIDFDSTIVATTTAGAEALLDCEGLEALLVPADGRLDEGGDDINLP